MKNKIILSLLIFVAAVVLYIFKDKAVVAPREDSIIEDQKSLPPIINEPIIPLSKDQKTLAWNLFQKYLGFNKARDVEGIKSVVYKISDVCSDPKLRIDCEARMASAYEYGSKLKLQDFVNVWGDEKQVILATEFWIEDKPDMDLVGRFRSIIFFVKNEKGELRMLSFSPFQGGATNVGVALREEIDTRIVRWTEDRDSDGIADYSEECLDAKPEEECSKTDPQKRDTDGDGWWDGIEALF